MEKIVSSPLKLLNCVIPFLFVSLTHTPFIHIPWFIHSAASSSVTHRDIAGGRNTQTHVHFVFFLSHSQEALSDVSFF